MIRTLLVIVALGYFRVASSQQIRVFSEKTDDNKVAIFAENPEEYEQSVEMDAELQGMKPSEKLPILKVLPPKSKAYFVTLTPEPGKSYSYKYKYSYIQGDVTGKHDDKHVYALPYKKGESYIVGQSYHERPTHMDKYAVDFNMDEGTKICAIRDGVVTRIEQGNNKGCPREECQDYNNFVLIKHDDGSVADYSHIKKNGALVKVGDRIKTGQLVAFSGSTGWASGPHLHLEVYVMRFDGQESVKVLYQLDKSTTGIPKAGKAYSQEL